MLTIRAMSDGKGYSSRHLEHNGGWNSHAAVGSTGDVGVGGIDDGDARVLRFRSREAILDRPVPRLDVFPLRHQRSGLNPIRLTGVLSFELAGERSGNENRAVASLPALFSLLKLTGAGLFRVPRQAFKAMFTSIYYGPRCPILPDERPIFS